MGEQDADADLPASERSKRVLEASAAHDVDRLQKYIDVYKFEDCDAVDVQDDRGMSPLHATISACGSEGESRDTSEQKACQTIRFLLENGAIWNQLDKNDETPGCIAFRLGLHDAYQLLVDAGVRAEIILNRLDGYEELPDAEEDTEMGSGPGTNGAANENDDDEPPMLVESAATDSLATEQATVVEDVGSAEYLASNLTLTRDKLLDDASNGVMMAWESGIMKQSAEELLTKPELKILNIGAGMMIFDTYVQESPNKPREHHIVEAHPEVLERMQRDGWNDKSGVTVHEGRWQDVLPQLLAEGHTFDAIYYDTFAESYADFREFFSEYVLGLLEQDGKWSFFNGMGADRQISYDVYQKVVEIDLFEAGFDVVWTEIELPNLDKEWDGVKRKYWNIKNYRLPVCKFMD